MSNPGQLEEAHGGWLRRSRRYSPFNRSRGLRRVPDNGIGFAFICSLVLHAALICGLVRITQGPPWSLGAETSLVSMADLVPSVPASGQGLEIKPDPPAAPTIRTRTPAAPAPRQPEAVPAAGASVRISLPRAPQAPSPEAPPQATEPRAAAPEPATTTALLAPSDIADPLDAGLPQPRLSAPATAQAESAPGTAQAAAPALALTPVPMIPGSTIAQALSSAAADPGPALEDDVTTPRFASAPLESASAPVVTARPVGPVPAAPSRTPAAEAASDTRPASPLALGLGPVLVRLEGPRERVTDRPAQTISGRLLGGTAEQVVLYVNGEPIAVSPTQRAFEISVPLQPGSNTLRAVATGPAGLEAEDVITVQYVTPTPSNGIALATPADGLTLGQEDPPVVVVEGQVDDTTIGTVLIVANDRRIPVTTREGRFRQVLMVPEPLLRLWVETPENGSPPQRSQTVTVHRAGGATPTGVLVVQWPRGMKSFDVEVSASWRAQADRLDAPAQTVRLLALARPGSAAPSDVFYLRGVKPGVYTLAVRSRGAVPAGDVRSTFYFPDKAGFSARPLGAARLNGARTVLTRILMPHGILWSQDEWFSGVSESVDTVTKFRVPEGISWVERKTDLP